MNRSRHFKDWENKNLGLKLFLLSIHLITLGGELVARWGRRLIISRNLVITPLLIVIKTMRMMIAVIVKYNDNDDGKVKY